MRKRAKGAEKSISELYQNPPHYPVHLPNPFTNKEAEKGHQKGTLKIFLEKFSGKNFEKGFKKSELEIFEVPITIQRVGQTLKSSLSDLFSPLVEVIHE